MWTPAKYDALRWRWWGKAKDVSRCDNSSASPARRLDRVTKRIFTADESAASHGQVGIPSLSNAVMLDSLDETLS